LPHAPLESENEVMSASPFNLLEVLQRYAAGYFPMIDDEDPAHPVFFWDRWPIRAVLPLNAHTVARARRISRRAAPQFTIRYTTAVEKVLRHLKRAKDHSWVQGQVVDIYRALHAAGLLRTVEAWLPAPPATKTAPRPRPRLVGALLGIVLPGVFVAETMYGLVPDASKICLCQLVHDCHAAGFEFIDVQTPHDADEFGDPLPRPKSATPHPCLRLGEAQLPINDFLDLLRTTLARHFPGTLQDWLTDAKTTPAFPK
jgi:leucyl/phenylalanyl-tRNA---protein transferase